MTKKKALLKGFLALTLTLLVLGQPVPLSAAGPTLDFNGGRYTREEFLTRYDRPNFTFILGDTRLTPAQFFDMFAVALLHEIRLSEEEIAGWIYEYEANGGISPVELQLLHYTNIERARAGVPLLELCPALSMAARFKAEEMATLGYFAHESPVYGAPQNISKELFGMEDFRSENLTRRITRPRVAFDLVQSWLGSPGHRANMLDPSHRYLGVGIIENVMGMGVNYDGSPIPDRYASLGVQKFR